MRILAVDPGREKYGLVVAEDGSILSHRVVLAPDFAACLRDWGRRYAIAQVAIGDRTGQVEVHKLVATELPGVPIAIVREAKTTLLARYRYFTDHPPRGWRRLVPRSMQIPPEPYDDYAAVIILERFLESKR